MQGPETALAATDFVIDDLNEPTEAIFSGLQLAVRPPLWRSIISPKRS